MILLAEDDEDVRDMLAFALTGRGFVVEQVADGASAVAFLAHHQPCLIVLDLVMPGVDGRAVLAHMAAKGIEVPVVAVSALDEVPTDGVVASLRKPFDTAALVALAARYCSCRGRG